MKRFRDQLESEGLAEKKVRAPATRKSGTLLTRKQARTSHKRLSLEGAKHDSSTPKPQTHTSSSQAISPLPGQSPTPRAKSTQAEETHLVPHVDVTEEVNRRLQESRLRRLMQTPSTAQKRKYDEYDDVPRSEGSAAADEERLRSQYGGSEFERTPTKRLRSSGTFEHAGQRQDDGPVRYDTERFEDRTDVKRRKFR